MHSRTRFEGSHVPVLIPVSDAGSPGFDAHGRHKQNEAAWIDLPDDEFEAVD